VAAVGCSAVVGSRRLAEIRLRPPEEAGGAHPATAPEAAGGDPLTAVPEAAAGDPPSVTPDFTRKIECILYVHQDQFTHT
jgi:hypothetical protein